MRRCAVIIFMLLLCLSGATAQDSLSVSERVRPAGFDAGNLVSAGRSHASNISHFENEKFSDNLSLKAAVSTLAPRASSYGFASLWGVSLQKWCTSSFGLRASAMGGYIPYNFNGTVLPEVNVSAAALFNISSYIGGYDLSRFCEVSTVLGVGYSWVGGCREEHTFVGSIGVDVNMRVARSLSVYIEPYVPVYVNSRSLDYGFGTTVGLAYDFSGNAVQSACAGRYFLTLAGGLQVQNSALMRKASAAEALGFHTTLGVGRRFTDFFDMRLSAAYSRNTWQVYYGGRRMPSEYYALRLEGVLDVVRLVMRHSDKVSSFGCGVVAGPEVGFMHKKDLGYSLKKYYVGMAAGVHADCRLGECVSLFLEPRFTFVPYTAPNDDSTSYNINRNYYDSLFNMNIGLEIAL